MTQDLIRQLGLSPHPEGGHYRETLRLPPGPDGRSRMTAILFLLGEGERSHWHRVDADELWLWHAGAPLTLAISDEPPLQLGADVAAGERPQALVPAGAWQAASAERGWALVSCVVVPGFEFTGFELAPPDWQPRGCAALVAVSRRDERGKGAARDRGSRSATRPHRRTRPR